MSARHQKTPVTYVQDKAIGPLYSTKSDLQKLQNYGLPPDPPLMTMAGGGQSVGAGTNYPLQPPNIDLGTISASFTVNLAAKTAQYQKMKLHDPGSSLVISFDGLPIGKSVVFALDITNDNTISHPFTWPATLNGLPSLPTAAGSRYVIYIVGYRSSTESRYTVISSSSGSSTNLWSGITIDVDKDMQDKSLTNLNNVLFHTSGNFVGFQSDGAGKTIDFMVNSFTAATLSSDPTSLINPNESVFEIIDYTTFGAAIKLANLSPSSVNEFLGILAYDGLKANGQQQTYAQIRGQIISNSNTTFIGHLVFEVADGTGFVNAIMKIEGNQGGSPPSSLNMLANPIINCGYIAFDNNGQIFDTPSILELSTAGGGQNIIRFSNFNASMFDFTNSSLIPYNIQNLGTSGHFWGDVYLTDIFLIDTAHEILVSGGDLVMTIPSGNVFRFRSGLNDKLQIDNIRNAASLRNNMFFEIQPSSGNPLQVLKQSGKAAEFICTDGFQFDSSIVAASSASDYCGTFSQPWAGGAFLHGIAFLVSPNDPTTSDIPQGYTLGWVNTTSGTIRIYMNYGGILYYTSLPNNL